VLGRTCQECIDTGHHPPGIEYLYEECEHHKNRELKIFKTKAEALAYIYEELEMNEEQVMILPKEEIPDNEKTK
ncbi:uncharacterized protein METZ01_LOCUS393460, partial [marine metagenome]